ncbi:hypothetical protein ALI22I_06000, partial [Saccharothrix sp. ALI-22-I]
NAGGDVENAVVGDGNKTTQNSGDNSAVGGFGSGDTTNVSGNTQGDGSAIAVGGSNASGSNFEDNDTTFEDNDTTFEDNSTNTDYYTPVVEDPHDVVVTDMTDYSPAYVDTVDHSTTLEDNGTTVSGGSDTPIGTQ